MGHLDENWLFFLYCLGHPHDNLNNLAQARDRDINFRGTTPLGGVL